MVICSRVLSILRKGNTNLCAQYSFMVLLVFFPSHCSMARWFIGLAAELEAWRCLLRSDSVTAFSFPAKWIRPHFQPWWLYIFLNNASSIYGLLLLSPVQVSHLSPPSSGHSKYSLPVPGRASSLDLPSSFTLQCRPESESHHLILQIEIRQWSSTGWTLRAAGSYWSILIKWDNQIQRTKGMTINFSTATAEDPEFYIFSDKNNEFSQLQILTKEILTDVFQNEENWN